MSSEKSLIHSKFEAIRRKNNKEHGHFCLTLGALYKEKGLLEKAFQEFSEYTNICQNNQHDRLELAKVLREMGEIKVELKEYREGLSLINRYHDTAKALGDVLEVQRALTTLGRAHFIQGLDTESEIQKCRRFEKADEYNERAFDAIPKANSDKCTNLERKKMMAVIYKNRYQVLCQLKKFEEAERIFLEGEAMLSEAKFNEELYYLYELKAVYMTEAGNLEDAKAASNKSFMILDHLKDIRNFNGTYLDALRTRSRIFLLLADFEGAKRPLLKFYENKSSKKTDEWAEMCSNLKCVIRILQLHAEIAESEEESHSAKCNEKIADICIKMDLQRIAIDYYLRSLDSIKRTNADPKKLSSLYYSIASTYDEIEDYEKAVHFYNLDLEVCSGLKPTKSVASLIGLALCVDKTCNDRTRVIDLFKKARSFAVQSKKDEINVLTQLCDYLDKIAADDEKNLYLSQLQKLNSDKECSRIESSDDEQEDESDCEDINLDKVLAEEEEKEDLNQDHSKRRNKLKKAPRVNGYGETSFHLLCKAKGNLSKLHTLLKTDMDFDTKDDSGFIALHEACLLGEFDYVEALVKAESKVNTKNNDGVTPLMDACESLNGPIIDFLLNSGADPNVIDKANWNAKDHFMKYYKIKCKSTDPEERAEVESLKSVVERLRTVTKEDPCRVKSHKSVLNIVDGGSDEIIEDTRKATRRRMSENALRFRHRSNSSGDDHDSRKPSVTRAPSKQTKLYSNAIQNLRGNLKLSSTKSSNQKSNSKSQMIDMRRTVANDADIFDDIDSFHDEKSNESNDSSRLSVKRKTFDEGHDISLGNIFATKKLKRKSFESEQSIDQNISLNLAEKSFNLDPEKIIEKEIVVEKIIPLSTQIANLPPSQAISTSRSVAFGDPKKIKVIVKVEDHTLLVPFRIDEKVKSLSAEVSHRYYSKSGQKLVLRLYTSDGAELHPDDSLVDIFDVGVEIRLEAKVVGYDVGRMDERYDSMCLELKACRLANVSNCLTVAQTSGILDLKSGFVQSERDSIVPLLRCFQHQPGLVHLNLAGSRLAQETQNIEILFQSLESLSNLKELDLSLNGLTFVHLQLFLERVLTKENTNALSQLKHLNLGFNYFGDHSSLALMGIISRLPQLESIEIPSCNLTDKFFEKNYMDWSETLSAIRSPKISFFNISGNGIGVQGLEILLDALSPAHLLHLDASGCCFQSSSTKQIGSKTIGDVIAKFARRGNPDIALQSLDISRNRLESSAIRSLSVGFYHMGNLRDLNLSNNPSLNTSNVHQLLQELWTHNVQLLRLNLGGCPKAFTDKMIVDGIFESLTKNLNSAKKIEKLTLNCADETFVKDLSNVWNSSWGKSAEVVRFSDRWTFTSCL